MVLTRKRRYYAANSDRFKQWYLSRYARDPELFKARAGTRRARKKAAEGRYTSVDIARIYVQQGGKCANIACRRSLANRSFHVDHIMPLILHGSNWPENLQLLCPTCNRAKAAKPPSEWATENGTLF
ncbi:MAG: HNH endonuclease [Acidobacteriota bacterium]